MAKAKTKVTAETVVLDFEQVEALVNKYGVFKQVRGNKVLVRMKDNRMPKASRRKQIVEDIHENEWENTGQGIIFSSRNQLLDGQNRIMAFWEVLQTNPKATFEILVVSGVSPKAYAKLDGGTPRTLSDAIRMGAKYTDDRKLFEDQSSKIAQLARYIFLRTQGKDLNASTRIPPHKILEFTQKEHPASLEALAEVLELTENPECKERLSVAPVSYWAAFLYLASMAYDEAGNMVIDETSAGYALDFLKMFAHNVDHIDKVGDEDASQAAVSHPVGRLRKTILEGTEDNKSLRPHIKFGLIIKAFLAWMDQADKMRSLKLDEGECPRLGGIDLSAEEYKELFSESDESEAPEEPEVEAPEAEAEEPEVEPEPEEEAKPKRARRRLTKAQREAKLAEENA